MWCHDKNTICLIIQSITKLNIKIAAFSLYVTFHHHKTLVAKHMQFNCHFLRHFPCNLYFNDFFKAGIILYIGFFNSRLNTQHFFVYFYNSGVKSNRKSTSFDLLRRIYFSFPSVYWSKRLEFNT